jgi:hypothetical protein
MADAQTNPLGTSKTSKVMPPAGADAAAAEVAAQVAPVVKKYEVQKDFEVPRGASSFLLRQGQQISSQGYDIAGLVKIGVRLKEVA